MIEVKKYRLVFDGSFKFDHDTGSVNSWTHKKHEPPLVFPQFFTCHLKRIYNLRITHPEEEIYLWDDDVISAFLWVKLNPDISSVFVFRIQNLLCITTGQTFSSNTSPFNWEVLAQARCLIGEHLLAQPAATLTQLSCKHHAYLEKYNGTNCARQFQSGRPLWIYITR